MTGVQVGLQSEESVLGFVWSLIELPVQLLIHAIVGTASSSIIGNAGLIKKIYVPRGIFTISAVGSATIVELIDLFIAQRVFARLQVNFAQEL